jgi:septal ring factor EnvC (AmiA/AmiB activator)
VTVHRRFSSSLAFAALAALCIAATVRAQPSTNDARTLARDAEQRMRELQAEADRLAARSGSLLAELRKLQLERDIKAQAVRKADAELAATTAAVTRATARLKTLEAARVAGTPGVKERLVEIYKRGRGGYLRLLLATDDLRAMGRMSRGVAAVAEMDRMRFEEHRRTIRAEQATLEELESRRAELSRAQAEAVKARQALDMAVAAHNRRIDEIDARRDLAARYVGELQAAAVDLQRRAAGLTSDAPVELPLAAFRGALDWPVNGRIVSRFGRSAADRFGTVINRNGMEISAADGVAVRAVHGGTVAFAAPFVGYGTLVILDHGENAFTVYGHLEHTPLKEGVRVSRGSMVGRAGRNPNGQPVVYFEVRIDGRPVDPVQWLRSTR